MPPLDELDQQIIQVLRTDGRLSNVEIARRLASSEATVRRRVNRLVKSGVLRIVALTNPFKIGFTLDVVLNVRTELRHVPQVAATIASWPEVRTVSIVAGSYQILVGAMVHSPGEFADLLTGRLGGLEGVKDVQAVQVLRVVKRTFDWMGPELEHETG